MSNLVNPQFFVITPPPAVPGVTIVDYTIRYAAAPGNVPPAGWPIAAPAIKVPQKDLTVGADGNIRVPFPDIVTNTLADGTYVADCAADSATREGGESNDVFFDILAPAPGKPGFGVA